MMRIIGDNSHGNRNELNIVVALNDKTYSELNLNLKNFVMHICENQNINLNNNTKINAEYESNTNLKQDFYLYIENNKICVSLKMGSGNSVHQEKCEDFVSYIKDEFNASEKICDTWRLFLWADGTLDGTAFKEKDINGNIISRFTATQFKTLYPDERKLLQDFLNLNQKKLIEHFLFQGRHNSRVDFIYHGTSQHGIWISKKAIIDYQIKNALHLDKKCRSCLTVGKMSVQSWNVSRKGNSEKKRGQLQVKYGKMESDFYDLMSLQKANIGTFEGDIEEFDLSKTLNRNKDDNMWKILLPDISDLSDFYVVKVTTKPVSKLSGKKVYPKTDAYVIKAKLSKTYLLEKEYVLTEDDFADFEYEIVHDTGISIKIKDSKNYTIQKFTKDSFIKAFTGYGFETTDVLLALLIYSKDKERFKNEKIANDLGLNYELFLKKMNHMIGLNSADRNEKKYYDSIRNWAQEIIIKTIKSNKKLQEEIFMGKHWFVDPYYASYMFVHGNLINNKFIDFIITTGSGRSKRRYSIEVKPWIGYNK